MSNTTIKIGVRIAENKYLYLGRKIKLFGCEKKVVGLWRSSIVAATEKPRTMAEAQVQIYTPSEMREFYEEGQLEGLVEVKK